MYLNLLAESLSWDDRLSYIAIGVALGLVVVFAVLALLWAILAITGKVFGKSANAPKAPKAVQTVESAPAVTVAPAPAGDDAIVVAISAALAVYLETEGQNSSFAGGFRVVSFKKVGKAAHWNQN